MSDICRSIGLMGVTILAALSSADAQVDERSHAFSRIVGGPTPLVRVEPHYPAALHLSGLVVIKFIINDAGSVVSPSTLSSIPEFERASHRALELWKYNPRNPNDLSTELRKGCAVFVFLYAASIPDLNQALEACKDVPRYEEPTIPDWTPEELPT